MCDSCDWEDVLEEIDDMVSEERYDFAADTLNGIRDWIEENQHVTERQKDAVTNIQEAVER